MERMAHRQTTYILKDISTIDGSLLVLTSLRRSFYGTLFSSTEWNKRLIHFVHNTAEDQMEAFQVQYPILAADDESVNYGSLGPLFLSFLSFKKQMDLIVIPFSGF